jgi:YVTN family beta-propeller protein
MPSKPALLLFALLVAAGCAHFGNFPNAGFSPTSHVGIGGTNLYVTPTGQLLTPAGFQIELPGMRPQVLALSPDQRLLVTAGKQNVLAVIDSATRQLLQRVPLTATADGAVGQAVEIGLTGLAFAPDGTKLFVSTVEGGVRAFGVHGTNISKVAKVISLPAFDGGKKDAPAGLAVSADNRRLYVAGNIGNRLFEFDAETGTVLRSWPTGVAPFDIALVGGKAYVSNLGGPVPAVGDLSARAGRDSTVRVDPVRFIANCGSVSVVDLASDRVIREIAVELHPSALAVSPDQAFVVAANAGSDTLSVIDTRTDQVLERIGVRRDPGDPFGAQPNGLAFDPTGERLFVCNGTQNAVAVVAFQPRRKASKILGLIPVGWFPGAVLFHAPSQALCVANIKGLGAIKRFAPGEEVKLNSHVAYGAVSLIPMPTRRELRSMEAVALGNLRHPRLLEAKLPPRANQPARPVPERVGEPSVFRHVVYIIKENRSYDQVLGDMPQGDGNPKLCTFGETNTPNQHKIAREFVLLDNTYCSGVQSADGHQWTDAALANAYTERQLTAGYPRSYSGGKGADAVDALSWASSGFIWDNALAHGKNFRNYGEWMLTAADWRDKSGRKGEPEWIDFWRDHQNHGSDTVVKSTPSIESLRRCSDLAAVGWDLRVPDVVRAAEFIRELHRFEAEGGFPEFSLIFLPNDHTGGAREKFPKAVAQIADNDLALGQIVDALSHGKFWSDTCLFAIEDDAQAGWDHVSGYRTTCYVASPYTKRGETVSVQYNQLSLLRTMELILGLPPMNQLDATATPMTDCFVSTPNFTPFTSVPNRIPLDQINPAPKKIANAALRRDAVISAALSLDEEDKCPEDVLNRILWRSVKGPDEPYPDWAVNASGSR